MVTASVNLLLSSYTERGPMGFTLPPVSFLLRMLQGIAVTFRGGRDEVFGAILARDIEGVKGAQRPDFKRGDSVQGIVHGTGGAGEVEHVIHRPAVKALIDINLLKFKARVVAQMIEIGQFSGQQVIDGDDGIAFAEQSVAQVRAQKSGSASYQGARLVHDFLILPGAASAPSAGVTGVPASRPTL